MAAAVDPEELTALLAVPPDEFVAARTARVKELKAAGEKEAAAALAKVRKPVRLVWVVGELARQHPDLAATAAEAATELEEAQSGGGGVRPLLKRFRDVVGQVAALADEVEGTVDVLEVGLALREVLADADARQAWVEGRLLVLPGNEDDGAPADELAPRRAAKAKKAAAKNAAGKKSAAKTGGGRSAGRRAAAGAAGAADDDAGAEEERRAEEERKAEEEAKARAKARRQAEDAVAAATDAVEEATSSRDEAAEALAALEEELAALDERVAAARAALDEADAGVTDAEARRTAAEQALADLPEE